MAGAGIHIDMSDMRNLQRKLDDLAGFNPNDLLDVLGATVESQTRRRIGDEKTSPDGESWPEWSAAYDATRHSGHSRLIGEEDLIDSIDHVVGTNDVEVGSNLIYAATHQFGDDDRNIPARQWLGLSDDDELEIQQVITDWFEELLS